MMQALDTRPSAIAGQWYPGDPARLAASVDRYIQEAKVPPITAEIVAVIAPHAGHLYSGPVAGYAFAAIRGLQPELVAVLSPCHYYLSNHPLLTTGHAAYETPLGVIEVDQQAVQALHVHLQEMLGFGLTAVREDPEHSLEIELPFLQRALNQTFRLLPVMIFDLSPYTLQNLGLALAKVLQGKPSLVVASTDLSHHYPQVRANALDAEMLRRIEAFDPEGVLRAEEEGVGFACGRAAVASALWAARELGANAVKVLHHATSGDVTGDYSQVVGYGAAVVLRQ